jgi:aryl-alcohol dehydrogenase-like predicted oxidoreductase
MIHWPDPQIDIRKPLEVLVKAQAEGKIRHLGLCNTTPDDLELASQITRIELVQSQFNYFSQNDFKSLRPQLSSKNLSFMSWGTFDKGILSGRVQINSKFDSSDARSWAPWWKSQNLKGKLQEVEKLKFFASSIDLTLSQLALAWQFIYPEISSSLIGWKTIEDLNQSLSDLQKISHSHIEKIKLFAEN